MFKFEIKTRLKNTKARTGLIKTPHGIIKTPAFIVVGTKASVKALTFNEVSALNAQAVLANAYHLYLQPGQKIIEAAGGLSKFMNWPGPTFCDSGGFQVLSLGSGYKKVLALNSSAVSPNEVLAPLKERHAFIDADGVTFKSHLDGSSHRFTPELSIQIQHALGADIIFAFDELTSLLDTYDYQVESLERTNRWALRSLEELTRLRKLSVNRPYQALYGIVQGAQYQNLRIKAAQYIAKLDFDGIGIGGAFEKEQLAQIIGWVVNELPEEKPRHLLGISEPDDIFKAIECGIDTFDCVSPTRVARNGAAYTPSGRQNISTANNKEDFGPIDQSCNCYTCQNHSRAYLHHLLHAKELSVKTLLSIHNLNFIISLVDDIRGNIEAGSYEHFKRDWLKRYYK